MDPGFNSLFNNDLGSPQPSFVILISYVFSIAVALALLGLGGFHAWLVYKGLTTLELHGREEVRELLAASRRGRAKLLAKRARDLLTPLPARAPPHRFRARPTLTTSAAGGGTLNRCLGGERLSGSCPWRRRPSEIGSSCLQLMTARPARRSRTTTSNWWQI